MVSGVETQIGRSWRSEPLSLVSSWKSWFFKYLLGSAAGSSVEASLSTAGADQMDLARFMNHANSLLQAVQGCDKSCMCPSCSMHASRSELACPHRRL